MYLEELTGSGRYKNYNITGRLRKTRFLYYLLKKGDIEYSGDIIKLCTQLDSMITILNQNYKDNWDMYLYSRKLHIVIRFKEIVISNTEGRHHIIKELFVKLKLKLQNTVTIESYEGTRAQRSIAEEVSDYSHSHLSRYTELNDFSDFCYTSTEVYDLQAIFNSSFDINTFDLLLQTINTYVRHESLEGVPHTYISNIKFSKGNENRINNDLNINYLEEIFNNYIDKIGNEENPIQYHFKDDNYVVIDVDYLRKELKRIFLDKIDDISKEDLVEILVNKTLSNSFSSTAPLTNVSLFNPERVYKKDYTEDYIKTKSKWIHTNNEYRKIDKSFLFRGEDIKITNYTTIENKNFKENEKSKEEYIQKGEVREQFIYYVKEKLEYKLNKERKIKNFGL